MFGIKKQLSPITIFCLALASLASSWTWGEAVEAETDRVWQKYHQLIETTRKDMLARDEAENPQVRAQALYALQAAQAGVFHFIVAARQEYPNFYRESIWGPYESTWGGPASDFVYQWTFLDGARTYRISGKRGNTLFANMQLWNGYFIEGQRSLGEYDFDDFTQRQDGSFEVILSPNKHEGNWVQLDPQEHDIVIQVRDAHYDWGNEQRLQLSIECLDCESARMVLEERELNDRIKRAAELVRAVVYTAPTQWYDKVLTEAGGLNTFMKVGGDHNRDGGASPRAFYLPMNFSLEEDEALIIESDVPDAKYWSIQLTDLWWQTLDFTYHQSGLNGHQAEIDRDGKFRAVIALQDPGVPNWIDPVGTPIGQVMMRYYDNVGEVSVPSVRRVKLVELRQHLPAETPVVTPEERAASIAERAAASLSRWGN